MKPANHMVDVLFLLTLFGVLAVSSLFVVTTGANVYQETVQRMDDHFEMRTPLAYLAAKVRQNDMDGAVFVAQIEGVNALVLEQTFNDTVYQTWIYHDEGMLKELFLQKGDLAQLQFGQEIMNVSDLQIEQTVDELRFKVTDSHQNAASLTLCLRS